MSLKEKLTEGFNFKEYLIKAEKINKGRFKEEINFEIYLIKGIKKSFLLNIKYFEGRKPYYRKWIEIFNIRKEFFNSEYEEFFLSSVSDEIKEGEKILIEYVNDEETYQFLFKGYPVSISRLGFKLLKLSFTFLKNFYVPEGYWEGSQKIIAEKAINETQKEVRLNEIKKEIEDFYLKYKNSEEKLIKNAILRIKQLKDYL
ncbi:MAG: DUF1122 family protein [Candidatus Hydrothermales bacterium]